MQYLALDFRPEFNYKLVAGALMIYEINSRRCRDQLSNIVARSLGIQMIRHDIRPWDEIMVRKKARYFVQEEWLIDVIWINQGLLS